MSSIKKNNKQLFVENCFSSDKTMKEAILFNHKFEHKFGTQDKPSKEALYLKLKAREGDAGAQFLWSLVLGIVYKNKIEAIKWRYKSADQNFEEAILVVVNNYFSVNLHPKSKELKQRVAGYLKFIGEEKSADAKRLLKILEENTSKEELVETYKFKLNNYKEASTDEILNLGSALGFGIYRVEGSLIGLQVSKNIVKRIELYNYLKDVRKNVEAAYLLGLIFETKNLKLSLESYAWAAQNGHAHSATWLGEHYACIGNQEKAYFWLNKATKFGSKFSALIIDEIEHYGMPVNCIESS